jgi:hypothetical protein
MTDHIRISPGLTDFLEILIFLPVISIQAPAYYTQLWVFANAQILASNRFMRTTFTTDQAQTAVNDLSRNGQT